MTYGITCSSIPFIPTGHANSYFKHLSNHWRCLSKKCLRITFLVENRRCKWFHQKTNQTQLQKQTWTASVILGNLTDCWEEPNASLALEPHILFQQTFKTSKCKLYKNVSHSCPQLKSQHLNTEQSSDNNHYSWSNSAEYCLKKVGWHIRMKKQTVLQEKDKLTFEIVLGDLWQAKDLGLKRLAEEREPLKIHWLKFWKKCPPTAVFVYLSISFFQEGSRSILFNNSQARGIQ